jgi:putative toxin-antitoxin system antitoxin component (TIGR02293 family)
MAQEKDNVGSLTTIEVRCSKVTPDAPGKTMDLQQIIQRAVEVFEGEKAALDWLQSPNSALGGCSPISTLNTEVGKLEVANTLGRIEHGVFK